MDNTYDPSADLDALSAAATPAPWGDASVGSAEVADVGGCNIYAAELNDDGADGALADIAFIVALRNAYANGDLVPAATNAALVGKVERLRGALAKAEAGFDDCADHFDDLGRPALYRMAIEMRDEARAALSQHEEGDGRG